MTAADVVKDIEANLIPDATLIPAMVGEISLAQARGYALVFVPKFTP
jgi:hypothetical protein